MQKIENELLTFYQSSLLNEFKELTHAFLTKKGGVSQGNHQGLNMAFHSSDSHENVSANHRIVKEYFNIENLFYIKQVHQDHILSINKSSNCYHEGFDAMTTNQVKCPLMILHADCQPAIFYDPIQKAIATVHSGWRGSVLNIYEKTINYLEKQYGSKRENIFVAIGPSLSASKAEFKNYQNELPSSFWDFKDQKDCFDFWQISKQQLLQAKILPEHIDLLKICTFTNSEEFFSFRRQKDKTSLHGANATLAFL